MKYNVTEIEFDFDDDYANGFELTFDEEIEEYANCDFKKDRRDDTFIDINNTGGKY